MDDGDCEEYDVKSEPGCGQADKALGHFDDRDGGEPHFVLGGGGDHVPLWLWVEALAGAAKVT